MGVGDSIVQGISAGLEDADYLLVVLSQNSVRSRWVQNDARKTSRGTPALKLDRSLTTDNVQSHKRADFRFFSSSIRKDDALGDVRTEWTDDELQETDSLESTLPADNAVDEIASNKGVP